MKKRGDKRADITLWFLVEVVAAVFVAYLLSDVAMSYASGSVYTKTALAKELAMQINALYAVPENAYIITKNPLNYSVHVYKGKVEVFESANEFMKGSYNFVPHKDLELDTVLEKPRQIVISKTGSIIKVSEEIPALTSYATSEKIDFKDKKILFSAMTSSEYGEQLQKIVDGIDVFNKNYNKFNFVNELPADIIINIDSGKNNAQDIIVYILSESEKKQESYILASCILQRLSELKLNTFISYIEPSKLQDGDIKKSVLSDKTKTSIQLEIKNIENAADIAKAVYYGLEDCSE